MSKLLQRKCVAVMTRMIPTKEAQQCVPDSISMENSLKDSDGKRMLSSLTAHSFQKGYQRLQGD